MRKIAEVCAPPIPPAWSPDGSTLALCAYTDYEHAYEWNDVHVITIRADGSGAKRVWTRSLDRLCQIYMATDIKPFGAAHSPPLWSPDGRRIYFLASDRGNGRLYSVTLPEGEISPLTHGAEVILDFHGRPDTGRFALLIADPDDPGDIFTCAVDPARGTLVEEKRRLTTMNQTHLEGIAIGRTEEVTLPSFDGTPIHGFVLYPPDFDRTKKYPLILEMHGGPHILSGNIFFHEYHVLSGAGFIVATFNHRGSQGYGEDFAAAIARDWGRIDYQDLMACVDRLCERPYVDEERLGVAGGSYGGYMTMWIVTQTDRFKAAVSFRAVSNLYSVAGTADMGFDNAREYGAQPWEDREHLFRMSPISHVQNVTTPILIVQAEEDLRCPIEQAEQFYFAL
ncbi:MAG: S9 family peptidase, partial [Deltaproteobacteria bacterium]